MPVHFVSQPEFVWPPAPPVRACPPRPKPKKKRKPRRSPRKPLPVACRTVLIDRVEAATLDGRIALCAEDMGPCESLDFTLAELAFLMERVLFPEEYADPSCGRKAPRPTKTAPGSADRIAEYAFRLAQRRVLCVAGDATAHGAHDRGLKIVQRANGSGVKVVGWADEG